MNDKEETKAIETVEAVLAALEPWLRSVITNNLPGQFVPPRYIDIQRRAAAEKLVALVQDVAK